MPLVENQLYLLNEPPCSSLRLPTKTDRGPPRKVITLAKLHSTLRCPFDFKPSHITRVPLWVHLAEVVRWWWRTGGKPEGKGKLDREATFHDEN